MKNFLQICILCVAIHQISSVPYSKYRKDDPSRKKDWDYLTFTQTWPPASCLSWQASDPDHKCNITSAINTWTVHGIWPSSSQSDDPAFCNKSLHFNTSEIQSIKLELDKYWANVYAGTPEDQLWEHEWEKHGTCASILPVLDTELRFFTQGLNWVKQYNMIDILKKSGISPSSQTPVLTSDIENAVHNALKVKPLLVCDYFKGNKSQYIYEIEICFDKSLKLMHCPSNEKHFKPSFSAAERCPQDALVWYPPITPTKLSEEKTSFWPDKQKLFRWLSFVTSARRFL